MNSNAKTVPTPEQFAWLSDEVSRCPFDFYESLRTHAPVHQSPGRTTYGSDVYLVSRWEDIVSVVKRPEVFQQFLGDAAPDYTKFAGACPYPDAPRGSYTPFPIFYTDGKEHREKRKLGLRLVDGRLMKSKEAVFRTFADELIDGVIDDGRCDFVSAIAEPYPAMVIHELLGLPRDELSEWTSKPHVVGEPVIAPVAGYVERVVLERYKSPHDDLVSEAVREQAERDGGLDLNWHIAHWSNILIAGSVTSVAMLTNLMMHLLLRPDVARRIRDDRTLLRVAVEESLRLETPIQVLPRIAREDAEVGGVLIPAGATLALLYGSGNRDPDKFEDPTTFDLDRERLASSQLAFGLGRHHCLGAPVARMEAEILFNCLFDRTTGIRFVGDLSQVTRAGSIVFSEAAKPQLHVEFARSA